jgi:hypothetical protein
MPLFDSDGSLSDGPPALQTAGTDIKRGRPALLYWQSWTESPTTGMYGDARGSTRLMVISSSPALRYSMLQVFADQRWNWTRNQLLQVTRSLYFANVSMPAVPKRKRQGFHRIQHPCSMTSLSRTVLSIVTLSCLRQHLQVHCSNNITGEFDITLQNIKNDDLILFLTVDYSSLFKMIRVVNCCSDDPLENFKLYRELGYTMTYIPLRPPKQPDVQAIRSIMESTSIHTRAFERSGNCYQHPAIRTRDYSLGGYYLCIQL